MLDALRLVSGGILAILIVHIRMAHLTSLSGGFLLVWQLKNNYFSGYSCYSRYSCYSTGGGATIYPHECVLITF